MFPSSWDTLLTDRQTDIGTHRYRQFFYHGFHDGGILLRTSSKGFTYCIEGIFHVSWHVLLDNLFNVLVGVSDELLEHCVRRQLVIGQRHFFFFAGVWIYKQLIVSQLWSSPFLRWGKLLVHRILINFISMSSESALHASASSCLRESTTGTSV